METFSIILYFDPFGDKKSTRKVFSRKFFAMDKDKKDIERLVNFLNTNRGYYSEIGLRFKPYKKAKKIESISEIFR